MLTVLMGIERPWDLESSNTGVSYRTDVATIDIRLTV